VYARHVASKKHRKVDKARSRSLVASAQPMDRSKPTTESGPSKGWESEVWDMYDSVGEYRQGVKWLSNVLSRARLIAAQAPQNPGDEPTPIDPDTEDPAVDLVQAIGHGIGGQSELLRSATVHLTVPGEGWFVGQVEGVADAADLAWKFYSRDEVRTTNQGVTEIKVGDSTWTPLPEQSLPVRVWRPHDRYHWKADSSSRAALPILRRLELLNRKVDAQIQSRLASNGMYWIPEQMDFPEKERYAGADDAFTAELLDLWTTAIKTPGSAAAAVPYIARAKAEWIGAIRYDEFAKLIDPQLREDREFEIRRLSTAMDVPPEVLLGMVNMNHWGAWQVEESALKTTVTNLLELICWSLTTGYLWPALGAINDKANSAAYYDPNAEELPTPDQRVIWYDLSELAVRPDRSADAITLWNALAITDEALLRETGFNADDLLTNPEEFRRRLGTTLAQNASTTAVGLELVGITTAAKVEQTRSPQAEADVPAAAPDAAPGSDGALPPDAAPQAAPATSPVNGDRVPVPA
jgi:hypothetical protein